jgi:hypothetical protein
MSYEYSAANQRFEIPNPYRVENLSLILSGAAAILIGLVLLIGSRNALSSVDAGRTKGLLIAFGLLSLGLVTIGVALAQLRYFFGRGRPADLYDPRSGRPNDAAGRAAWLKENLRQNALVYREPKGPISGLVHSVFDTLIFAPEVVRRAAETQCFNLLFTLAILLGLVISLFLYPAAGTRAWIAAAYLVILVPKLLWPFRRAAAPAQKSTAGIGSILLIVGIPVLLPQIAAKLPDPSTFELSRTLLVTLVLLVCAQAAFFIALTTQLRPRPAANMACEQRTLSMNANPAKLYEELQRQLQARWTESVPNRLYAQKRLPEVISGQSGSFDGEALEETQPLPVGIAKTTWLEQILAPTTRAIAALNAILVVSYIAGCWIAFIFGKKAAADHQLLATGFLAAVLLLIAHYCWRSAHALWGRVDFQSTLLWIELAGSFEEAQVNVGNQFTSAMSSGKKVINVESMTLRVWAADLDTVVFDKDGARDLIGMQGRPDVAKYYADHLERFAAETSSVVAPGSTKDRDRLNAFAGMSRQLGGSAGAAPLPPAAAAAISAAPEPPYKECRNPACRRQMPRDAAFCSSCGTPL